MQTALLLVGLAIVTVATEECLEAARACAAEVGGVGESRSPATPPRPATLPKPASPIPPTSGTPDTDLNAVLSEIRSQQRQSMELTRSVVQQEATIAKMLSALAGRNDQIEQMRFQHKESIDFHRAALEQQTAHYKELSTRQESVSEKACETCEKTMQQAAKTSQDALSVAQWVLLTLTGLVTLATTVGGYTWARIQQRARRADEHAQKASVEAEKAATDARQAAAAAGVTNAAAQRINADIERNRTESEDIRRDLNSQQEALEELLVRARDAQLEWFVISQKVRLTTGTAQERQQALDYLDEIRRPDVIPALLACILDRDNQASLRVQAIRSLRRFEGKAFDPQVRQVLRTMSSNNDSAIRKAAQEVMQRFWRDDTDKNDIGGDPTQRGNSASKRNGNSRPKKSGVRQPAK